MSKPVTFRGWVCALCIVPVLAIIATALLVASPTRHRSTGSVSTGVASQPGTLTPAARGRIQASYAALPLAFEANQGQTDAQVKYLARGNGYTLFLTANEAVFSLQSRSAEVSSVRRGAGMPARNSQAHANSSKNASAVVRMQLVGGNSLATVAASGQMPGTSNYFLGNDPSKWRTGVARYARVSYQDVYPGVNMAFHGAQRQPEFDFVVAPGANPAPIGFHFTGARRMNTDDSGNLVLSSAAGNVLLHKPVAYQDQNGARQAVEARFILKANNQVALELGNYDRSRELVIDPSVSYEYSTYLGGNGNDEGYGIAFDGSGNAYVTGQTASQNFPGTSGGFTGTAQVFVTKINAAGSALVYSTYVGGSGANGDSGNAIAVDSSGEAFVTGGTTSTDFPTMPGGVFQTHLGTGATVNGFVFKLSPSGAMTYSTYLGGTDEDVALGIGLASGASPDVYVVGKTSSIDFPTQSPLQGYLTGSTGSGFLTKLNSSATALVYSTYLGGSSTGNGDSADAVAVDSSDNAYVTGQTFSSTFHTTAGAFQTACGSCTGGNSNAFVTVINPGGSAYVYSTFLGGSGLDVGDGIAVDSAQSAYVTGTTDSSNFPTTSGAWQTTYGSNTDTFVTKLNPAGSSLVYSTYLGGSGSDTGEGIAVDGTNNAYVTGQTSSADFPTAGPTQSALNGGSNTSSSDAFVTEINPAGSAPVFSTYLGGSGDEDDGGFGAIAVDNAGATIYVTGYTLSTDFPTAGSAYQAANGGGGLADAFVVKYTQGPSFTIAASTPTAVAPGSSGASTVTLTSVHGYNSSVTLSCSVSGSGSPAPACSASSFSPDSVTPTTSGATSALTITTTGPSGAMLAPRKFLYAMWLPVAGLSLVGMGFGPAGSRRKKLLGLLMIGMIMAALFVMPACGGSNSGGGGGGGGGTPAGNYTVTITGTDANATTLSTTVTLTVN